MKGTWLLARFTIKGSPYGFVATFIAVLAGAALITAAGTLFESGVRGGGVEPERYAGAAVVVGADQSLPVPGDLGLTLGERVTLPAGQVAQITSVDGVKRAVGDVGFPVSAVAADGEVVGGPGGYSTLGHGWASAALGPFPLEAGRAPGRAGEVALDADLAARADASVGETVDLALGSAADRYRVVGVVNPPEPGLNRQSAVFFDDEQARALSGRPGRVDTVGVLADGGVDPDELAGRIEDEVSDVVTYTGSARGDAEFLDVGVARSFLVQMSAAFGGAMTTVVMLVVASTLSLSLRQRRREFALLRAIAASPRQIRRMVGAEALLVSAVGATAGVIPGVFLAFVLRDTLASTGALPADFGLALSPLPALAAILLCIGVARLAAFVASRRSAKISPVDALGEAAVEPPELGRVRVSLGLLLIPIALIAALVMPLILPGEYALAGAAGSALLLVISVAMLGPRLLTGAVGVSAAMLQRLFGTPGFLAAANSRANSRRLNFATTTLIMGITLAAVQIFTATTTLDAAKEQARTGLVADYVVTGTASGVSPEVAADLRAAPGVGSVTQVARTQVFATYQELDAVTTQPYAAQGINAAGAAANLDLDVRSGDLAELRGDDTVALGRMAAGTMRANVGETVDLRLGDGTAVTPRVVAVYGNGLGFGDVTLPHELVVEHTTARLDAAVLVEAEAGTDPAALGEAVRGAVQPYPTAAVNDRASFATAQDAQLAGQTTVSVALNAVLLGYIAIAVINTLVLATAARSREFALLQLVGTHPHQVRRMMRAETMIVVLTAVAVGLLAALPPLAGVSLGLTESLIPSISLTALAGIVCAAGLLGWFSIMIPTGFALRATPVDAIGIRE